MDFYVDIPERLIGEWNAIHENKIVHYDDAVEYWDKIYRVKTRKSTKGLAEWLKFNVQGEYCNVTGRNYWGFKSESDAVLFALAWR